MFLLCSQCRPMISQRLFPRRISSVRSQKGRPSSHYLNTSTVLSNFSPELIGRITCSASTLFVALRGAIVNTQDGYRRNAFDCLRSAQIAANPRDKAMLLGMAQSWVRLADKAQKNGLTDLVYEAPPRHLRPFAR